MQKVIWKNFKNFARMNSETGRQSRLVTEFLYELTYMSRAAEQRDASEAREEIN